MQAAKRDISIKEVKQFNYLGNGLTEGTMWHIEITVLDKDDFTKLNEVWRNRDFP